MGFRGNSPEINDIIQADEFVQISQLEGMHASYWTVDVGSKQEPKIQHCAYFTLKATFDQILLDENAHRRKVHQADTRLQRTPFKFTEELPTEVMEVMPGYSRAADTRMEALEYAKKRYNWYIANK